MIRVTTECQESTISDGQIVISTSKYVQSTGPCLSDNGQFSNLKTQRHSDAGTGRGSFLPPSLDQAGRYQVHNRCNLPAQRPPNQLQRRPMWMIFMSIKPKILKSIIWFLMGLWGLFDQSRTKLYTFGSLIDHSGTLLDLYWTLLAIWGAIWTIMDSF